MTPPRRANGAMRVMHTAPPPKPGVTTYAALIAEVADPKVENLFFSWRAALAGDFDILHVHWPEALYWGSRRWKRLINPVLTLVLLARLRLRRVPIVRTVHNVTPHEHDGPLGALASRVLTRRTAMFIHLTRHTCMPDLEPATIVPHPRYEFATGPRPKAPHVDFLFVGQLRPYKGIEQLVGAFGEMTADSARLAIVGAGAPSYVDELASVIAGDVRIEFVPIEVTDDELVRWFTQSQLVVLPYARMVNSGVLLAALSVERRVLIPRTATNEDIAREVGPGWISFFDGPLSLHDLERALAKTTPADPPDLSRRNLGDWGRMLHQAYSAVVGL
jgi:beta-1,4-mannosyltransferase